MTWIEKNGYQMAGPNRDYLLENTDCEDPDGNMSELVFPVAR
jgi:effector-binding domain-containing protein